MQKCLIFLLAFFSLTIQAQADWNPYYMDHERFVHLSEDEQQTVLIRTMEMMVELESKYERETKVSGFSPARYQKYVQVLNKLKSFLLSEAVAADLHGMNSNFKELMSVKNSCIYGGWPSQTVKTKTGTYCVHPSVAPDKRFQMAYKAATKSQCPGTEQITCNPMVFGFKKREGEKLFCIPTGFKDPKANKAHNVSYECMRSSLTVEKAGQDSKEKRLTDMANDKKDNKEAFNSVQSYIFRTCACNDNSLGMNEAYKNYIRPHRTCFGMMNSLRVFKHDECAAMITSFPKENTEFIGAWNKVFLDQDLGKLDVPPSKDPQPDDVKYQKLIDHGNVDKYCHPPKDPIKPDGPVEEDKPIWVCKAKCATEKPKEGVVAKAGEVPKIICTIDQVGWSTTKGGKTEVKPLAAGELISQEIVVTADELKALKASIGMKDATKDKQICELSSDPVVADKTCKITVVNDPDGKKSKATVAFDGLGKEVPEYTWTGGAALKEKPEEINVDRTSAVQPLSVVFKVKDAKPVAGEKPLSCAGEIPALDVVTDDNKYKIETSSDPLKSPKDLTVKVNAALSDKNGPVKVVPAGHQIVWARKGGSASKEKVVEKEKEGNGTKDDVVKEKKDDKKEEKKDDKKEEKKDDKDTEGADVIKEEVGVELGRGESINPTRGLTKDDKYEACASLIEDSTGASKAGPSCQPIPPLGPEEQKQQNYVPPQNGPPPVFRLNENHAPVQMVY